MDVTLPDGTIIKDVPDNISKAELTAKLARNGYDVSKLEPIQHGGFKSELANELADLGVGAIGEGAKFLGRILPGTTGEELQSKAEKALTPKNYKLNPEQVGYGRTMSDIGMGYGLGPTLGAASKLAGATKIVPALSSAGTNLGELTTGSKLANALMRSAIGGSQGAIASGLVNPEDIATGAATGGILSNIPIALEAGKNIAPGLMQSAIKPTRAELQSGEAQRAIDTLLREDISPNAKGVANIHGKINELNSEIADLVHSSPETISKQKVMDIANQIRPQLTLPVNSDADVAALNDALSKFQTHPLLQSSDEISVPLAQEMKQATYRSLGDKAYGELGAASKESQKALARGLKEQIAEKVPSIQGLNKRESDLINAANVAERRALMEGNKNPLGLGTLTPNKEMFGLHMADKSAAIKAKLARELYKMGISSKALENAGLVNVPAALSASNQGE
jgi:hypothetical protein